MSKYEFHSDHTNFVNIFLWYVNNLNLNKHTSFKSKITSFEYFHIDGGFILKNYFHISIEHQIKTSEFYQRWVSFE